MRKNAKGRKFPRKSQMIDPEIEVFGWETIIFFLIWKLNVNLVEKYN